MWVLLDAGNDQAKNENASELHYYRPISLPPDPSSVKGQYWSISLQSCRNGASNKVTASLMAWLHHACKAAACHSRFSCLCAALVLSTDPLSVSSLIFAPPESASGWSLEQHPDGRQSRERRSCVSAGSRDGGQSCSLPVLLLFFCSCKQHFTFHPWELGATCNPRPLTHDPVALTFHPSPPVVMVSVPLEWYRRGMKGCPAFVPQRHPHLSWPERQEKRSRHAP